MELSIQQLPARKIAGFHKVGPWEKMVPEGFEQLALWMKSQKITSGEWMAIYYDNPEAVPAEKLRCDTVITVPENFQVPPGSEGVMVTHLEGGMYAVARARVDDDNFAKPWVTLFTEVLPGSGYVPTIQPCFEHYLNDGSESGVWEIDMYVPVRKA